jgi:hypothetical protein
MDVNLEQLIENVKGFLIKKATATLFKLLAGLLGSWGFAEAEHGDLYNASLVFIGAVVSLLTGEAISWAKDKLLAKTEPTAVTKIK